MTERTVNLGLECVIVTCGFLYLWLIIRERRAGWWFGIAASLLSVLLFIRLNLLAESILYVFYVVAGLYGFFHWKYGRKDAVGLPITTRGLLYHTCFIGGGAILTVLLAQALASIGSEMVYVDAGTTVFSFIATWMVARKILENWVYWIVIDAVSVWLYLSRDAFLYAGQMGVYSVFAVVGLVAWMRAMKREASGGQSPE